jgi:hypothetical protein
MSGLRGLIFVITATTSIAAGAMPVLADEAAAVDEVTAAKEVVVATMDARDISVPAPEILVATTPVIAKPKTNRTTMTTAALQSAPPPPTRAAAAPQPRGGCFWCGRQIVLMLGVGY